MHSIYVCDEFMRVLNIGSIFVVLRMVISAIRCDFGLLWIYIFTDA